jgi:hypothetical protein
MNKKIYALYIALSLLVALLASCSNYVDTQYIGYELDVRLTQNVLHRGFTIPGNDFSSYLFTSTVGGNYSVTFNKFTETVSVQISYPGYSNEWNLIPQSGFVSLVGVPAGANLKISVRLRSAKTYTFYEITVN